MRVASINMNRGVSTRRDKLEAWLQCVGADVLCVQEPATNASSLPDSIGSMARVSGSERVAVWTREGIERAFEWMSEHWVRALIAGWTIDAVYLPAKGKMKRAAEIKALTRARTERRLIVGDFNMAPRPEDGLKNGDISDWTGVRERHAFEKLVASGMVDLGVDDPHRFTFVNRAVEGDSRHRCDLALVSSESRAGTTYRSDPTVQSGAGRFTDHSAILVELGSTRGPS